MDTKKYVSVICEYNPFHFGHKFQMEHLKSRFDGVVCIMSGDMVQRGEVAIASKYLRAKAALENGANLVLELPIPWCCSSAKDFAASGVHIAKSIGTSHLAFGSEDDLDILVALEDFLSSEGFSKRVKEVVDQEKSLSFPLAMNKVIKEKFGDEYADIASKPNNILSLEYLSALKGTNIVPYSVKRNFDFSSSSQIRSLDDGEMILKSLPEESKSVFSTELGLDFPRKSSRLDCFIIGSLRKMAYYKNHGEFYSVTDDLYNKIIDQAKYCNSFSELVNACTDKVYTSARVRRGVMSMVFDITRDRVKTLPPYTTVLAFDEVGREILKRAKKISEIPIITKPSKALTLDEDIKNAFTFGKYIEDIVSLSAPTPVSTYIGKTPTKK